MAKTEEISFTDFRVCFKISILFVIFCIVFQRECTQQFDGSVHVSSTWITIKNRKKSDAYNNSKRGKRFYKNNLASRTVCKVYAGENWKLNFISTVGSTVHNNPSRKRSIKKSLFKPEEFENTGLRVFVFGWTHNTSKTELSKNDGDTFPWPSFPQTLIKMTGYCLVFKFLPPSVDGKHSGSMCFQSETSAFKFLRRNLVWPEFSN